MAGKCFEDCHYIETLKSFRFQAKLKYDMFNHLQTSLNSLMTMEEYLGPLHLPGWTWPMNNRSVRIIIDGAIRAKNKCIEDIATIDKTIKDDCQQCKERREKSQIGQNQELLLTPHQEQQLLQSLRDVNFEEFDFDFDFLPDDNILFEPTSPQTLIPNSQEI